MEDKVPFPAPDDTRPDDAIAQAAAEWAVRYERGLTHDEASELQSWKNADQRHALEFEGTVADWRTLNRAREIPALSAEAANIVNRARNKAVQQRRLMFAGGLGAMAAAVAVAFLIVGNRPDVSPPAPKYHVFSSTERRLEFPDGSIARLNGDSRVNYTFNAEERRVRLVNGEAHFTVAKDSTRPFVVSAGMVSVQALGTEFDVRLAPSLIDIIVTQGEIRVGRRVAAGADAEGRLETLAPKIAAGHRVILDTTSGVPVVTSLSAASPSEMDEALAWQTTRLVFNNTPLDEVVSAFNRHNKHRLILGAPGLRNRTLSGTFRADNLDGFTRLLVDASDIIAQRRSSTETVLLPAR